MNRIAAIFVLIVGAVVYLNAQTPTVTNADLEKYRQRRVAAEAELAQKYAQMGFPSPVELERQRNRDYWDKIEYAEKLQKERLEREKKEAELKQMAYEAAMASQPIYVIVDRQGTQTSDYNYNPYPYYGNYPYYPNYPTYGNYPCYNSRFGCRYPRQQFPNQTQLPTYRTGGGMIMYPNGTNGNAPVFNFPWPRR